MRRFIAGLLVSVVMVSGFSNVSMAESVSSVNVSDESQKDEGIKESQIEGTQDEEVVDTTQEPLNEQNTADINNENKESEKIGEENQIVSDDDSNIAMGNEMGQDQLAYVYVEQDESLNSGEQNIVVAFADENIKLSSANLTYQSMVTEQEYLLEANVINNNTVLFVKEYSESGDESFQLSRLDYIDNSGENFIDFEEDGEIFEASSVSDTGETQIEDTTIRTVDENGNVIESEASNNTISDVISTTMDNVDDNVSVLALNNARTTSAGQYTVAICAGHDDNHTGAAANGLNEEKLTLKVAQYCKQELESYPNINVYMVRDSGTCPINPSIETSDCLKGRVDNAKAAGADYFIDIHFNSGAAAANGAEVWYPNDHWKNEIHVKGQDLANKILEQLEALGLFNRGPKVQSAVNDKYPDGSTEDWYFTNRYCKEQDITGIIIEHAFLTNAGDAAKLRDEAFLKELGKADATGIAKHLNVSKIDYSIIFDYNYYINRYPDIKAAFEGNPEGALQHFIDCGMQEGRQGNEEFDVYSYRARYGDLRLAFENDLEEYYIHYAETGKREGRIAVGEVELVPVTSYNGINYSPVYDYEYYLENNDTVKEKFEDNDAGALKYFINEGMKSGDQAIESFNVQIYKNNYADLRNSFDNDLKLYYLHYIDIGKKENRNAIELISKPTTIYQGKDYSSVYDYTYYIEHNSDVKAACKGDYYATLEHFVNCGMNEGRQGSEAFDVQSYRNAYADLRAAFRNDLKKYYIHYIDVGEKEGRVAKGVSELRNAVTTYNGKDYSDVYEYEYYVSHNADVKKLFEGDDIAVIEHFVNCGMNEGRQGNATFDVKSYRNANVDLRKAFRNNFKQYCTHFIDAGKNENRISIGVEKIKNPVTTYNGKNYSSVYDFEYYISHNADINRLYSNDDIAAIEHFVNCGMNEGRQASEEFNLFAYEQNYADLRQAFGGQNVLYYEHYLDAGKAEGRNARTLIYYSIMGNTSCTVDQMVQYFQSSGATYPYGNTDVPTIRDFCQVYINECNWEGVKAEVAFAQAMHETGFLRYGGVVDSGAYNFAGLGATDNDPNPARFSSILEGVQAHVQHLKAYASTEPLNNPCVDPRFGLVRRGTAFCVEWLGINENPLHVGWASDIGYGYKIKNGIETILNY